MWLFLDPNIFRNSFGQFLAMQTNLNIFFCHNLYFCLSRFVPLLLGHSQSYLTTCCLIIYYLTRCYLNIYYQTRYYLNIRGRNIVLLTRCYLTIRGRNIVVLTRCYLTIRGRNMVLLTRCLISCSPPQTSVTKDLRWNLSVKRRRVIWWSKIQCRNQENDIYPLYSLLAHLLIGSFTLSLYE